MRSQTLVVAALACLAAASLSALPASAKSHAAAAKATLVGAGDLKWADLPDTPAKRATVQGDATSGAHSAFIKLPAGFTAPLHSHTADHAAVVVSGTLSLTPEGGVAKSLGPGSWFEFTGMKKHTTKCEAGADCVLFMVSKGAWDLLPAAEKAMGK